MEAKPSAPLRRLKIFNGLNFVHSKLNIDLTLLNSLDQKVMHLKRRKGYSDFDQWWMLYFMGMLINANQKILKNIVEKFPLTKEEKKDILYVQGIKSLVKEISLKSISRSEVYKKLKPLPQSVLFFIRVMAYNKTGQQNIDRFLLEDTNIKLIINGNDLSKKVKVSGKEIGEILKEVLGQKIEGNIKNRSDELGMAYELLGHK